MVTFVQAVCEGTLYCVVTSWCYHVNQQPFNLKTLYNTDPRIMKIWVFQKIPQLKKLRVHFTTSIFLLNIWPFWGIFFPDFFSRNCVCVCVGEGDFFFSRLSGCCSLYFQWDVLSSLWAKGFFVYLSCSYFTFFQFHICFQFWVFLEMVLKIILHFLFLVYLTIFRSSCRLKYILGYRYSCKYTTEKANIR